MENNKIKVERETFESNGKEYFSYFIKGNVRGRDIKAGVIPPDKGSYTVLDIVFDGQMEAELIVTPFEIKDVKGKTIKGTPTPCVLTTKTGLFTNARLSLRERRTRVSLICF